MGSLSATDKNYQAGFKPLVPGFKSIAYGKIESLGGLIGGIAILLIAAFFIYESINRLQEPPLILLKIQFFRVRRYVLHLEV